MKEIILICLFISKIHKEIIQDCIQALQTFIILYLSTEFLNLYINIVHSLYLEIMKMLIFIKLEKRFMERNI